MHRDSSVNKSEITSRTKTESILECILLKGFRALKG